MFWIAFAFVMGLIFGSFANVVIYRFPQKKSIVKPPSACPSCEKQLTAWELIPILSWVFLKGRCRLCKAKISIRYPLVEIICGLLFAAIMYFSSTLSVIPLCVLAFVMLMISFIDWDTQEIPDSILIVGAVAGMTWVIFGYFLPTLFLHAPAWHNALLGIAAGAMPLLILDRIALLIWKKDGFGYGDVKLMAMTGIFLGWQLILLSFIFAIFICFPFAVYLMIKQRISKDKEFTGYMAFGPFLCIGAMGALWFGELILNALLLN